ncbi:hypothetical protein MYSI104531_26355 [Mycobacterium simiae]
MAVRLVMCPRTSESAVQAALHLTRIGTALAPEPAGRRYLGRPRNRVLMHRRGVGFRAVMELGLFGLAGGAHHRGLVAARALGRRSTAGRSAERLDKRMHLQPRPGETFELENQWLLVAHAVQVGLQLFDREPADSFVDRLLGQLAVGLLERPPHARAVDKIGDRLRTRAPRRGLWSRRVRRRIVGQQPKVGHDVRTGQRVSGQHLRRATRFRRRGSGCLSRCRFYRDTSIGDVPGRNNHLRVIAELVSVDCTGVAAESVVDGRLDGSVKAGTGLGRLAAADLPIRPLAS